MRLAIFRSAFWIGFAWWVANLLMVIPLGVIWTISWVIAGFRKHPKG